MADWMLSPNLSLRRPHDDDQRACTSIYQDRKVMAACGGPLSSHDANERFSSCRNEPDGMWTLERRSDLRFVGLVETNPEGAPLVLLSPECWGHGHATEIIWLLLTRLPDRIGEQMELAGGSEAARRVAERCGYLLVGSDSDRMQLRARSDRDQRLTTVGAYFQDQHERHIQRLHDELGIPENYGESRQLPRTVEAESLVLVGDDVFGRSLYLTAEAARAWQEMVAAADSDDVGLQPVSGFRDIDYQAGLIRRKLDQGEAMDQILAVSAAPGFSQHHGGQALDITTPDCEVLSEQFEHTNAFAWLTDNAGRFGFRLSYPRDNPHQLEYEPWHWARPASL
jgi:D-alanyl-D-alanine carboxypeptidase